MAHVFQERKVLALVQFPNTDWNIKDTGKLIVNGLTYKWDMKMSIWVRDKKAVQISSKLFLSFFKVKYGETVKVTLLLNLGGLSLAEMYKDKIVYRYGCPISDFHINLLHYTLTKDVIDIIEDGGESYYHKINSLL